jgi:hypothetical protein
MKDEKWFGEREGLAKELEVTQKKVKDLKELLDLKDHVT